MLGTSDTRLRDYSRDIAAYTLKQLVQWRSSLERLSDAQEQVRVQTSGDQRCPKGSARPPQSVVA